MSIIFDKNYPTFDPDQHAINLAYRVDEALCLEERLKAARLAEDALQRITTRSLDLAKTLRNTQMKQGGFNSFLSQYNLSNQEGIALMCLAEALLRVPDKATANQLIQDKISTVNWSDYIGKSDSLFVNSATWGLVLTGKLLIQSEASSQALGKALKNWVKRAGEPLLRRVIAQAMKMLGHQFVMGTTIQEALKRSKKDIGQGYRHSYDMLGEAACTEEDAERYFESYKQAIITLGTTPTIPTQKTATTTTTQEPFYSRPGISIKLSALYHSYHFAQREYAVPVLIDRLKALTMCARENNISVTVDAEEASRLLPSLEIIQSVFADPALADWPGFGLAVQAYQKRAMPLLDWLIALSKHHQRRLMVRLVKGAYWDAEIKESQLQGLKSYPVFTRKASTDVSFIACAKKIAESSGYIYGQFGTHNARSVATILELMDQHQNRDFEFQCLHGMGKALYDPVIKQFGIPCRIYAPVGSHQDLLPYLVRRLLENGANSSFVNEVINQKVSTNDLIEDPVAEVSALKNKPHPRIPLPVAIYQAQGENRLNALGLDLTDPIVLQTLSDAMLKAINKSWTAEPIVHIAQKVSNKQQKLLEKQREPVAITDPCNRQRVTGHVINSTPQDVKTALKAAEEAFPSWDNCPIDQRAACLERAAKELEAQYTDFITLLVREAGKTLPDAISEVREAVDFCRYYAMQARSSLAPRQLPSPTGETNQLSMHGRGIVFCISPWNFPLAIFMGQITAALAAGNTVIAKPARQTPLVAAAAVRLLHAAGIPKPVLQFLPGSSQVIGQPLLSDPRVEGILLTGSMQTAKTLQRALADRPGSIVPFIAETGGQNALIADSTALPEQLIADVIQSAFGSAGQRCSALRVLFIQDDVADKVIHMLSGAIAVLRVGDSALLANTIGPVIDESARRSLQAHVDYLEKKGAKCIGKASIPSGNNHTFFAPQAYEIPSLDWLKEEVFGPILHVIRYRQDTLDTVIQSINKTGFGLTLGIHSRIQNTVDTIRKQAQVGNIYVNRSIIGAVVGVQPFGGEGLSGTGPKAGGPHYLLRLCKERTVTINTTAVGGNATLLTLTQEVDTDSR